MAREAVLVYETELPLQMTVATGVGIEKGALLTLSDPLTAALVTASVAAAAGIAHSEHVINDGTKLSVYRGGVFKVTASGSVTVGDSLQFEGANYVIALGTDVYSAGTALETAADGETFLMELDPMNKPRDLLPT
jgi:uncharacterized protein with beta-barrel porin domain